MSIVCKFIHVQVCMHLLSLYYIVIKILLLVLLLLLLLLILLS